MDAVAGSGNGLQNGADYFINGHGPFQQQVEPMAVNESGIPEICAEDAPLDLSCPNCQTKANLGRWAS